MCSVHQRRKSKVQKGPNRCGHLPGSRLGVAVPTGVWASRCPRGGSAPSPLLQLVSRVLRREAAKACMLACVSRADHRAMSVVMVACLSGAGVALALAWASRRRNCVASVLQRPPTSIANTTKRHLPAPTNSGYVRSLLRRAVWRAAPAYWPPRRRGCASLVSGETRVVSTASWAPCHIGSPFAMTSMVRSSKCCTAGMLRLLSLVCMVTRAPASWHTLAAACSSGTPLLRSTPARAQAARWSPSGSRLRRHRQARSVRGNGSRRRRSSRMRKMWSGYVVSVVYGIVVKALLAKGPVTQRHPNMFGMTQTATSTPLHKQRGVNKGTPSCRPCSPWAKSQPYKPSKHSSNPAKSSTPFWVTFMQWCSQSASGPSTTC